MPIIRVDSYPHSHLVGLTRRLNQRASTRIGNTPNNHILYSPHRLAGQGHHLERMMSLVSSKCDRLAYVTANRLIVKKINHAAGRAAAGHIDKTLTEHERIVWRDTISSAVSTALRKVHDAVMSGDAEAPDTPKVFAAVQHLVPEAGTWLQREFRSGCLVPTSNGMYVVTYMGSVTYEASFLLTTSWRNDMGTYAPFVTANGHALVSCAVKPSGIAAIDESVQGVISCSLAYGPYMDSHMDYEWDDNNDRYRHTNFFEEDDDYDDDEDERNRDGLYEYHSSGSHRSKAVAYHKPMDTDSLRDDKLTLGFEAEIQIDGRIRALDKIRADNVLNKVSILEEDGSLDSRTGFEMVTGWSTLHTVCDWSTRFCDIVSEYEYSVENAGLHIAVGGLTELHVARVYGFVFDEANRPLLRDLAGRDYNEYAGKFYFMNFSHGYWRAADRQPPCAARKVAANTIKVVQSGESSSRYGALNYRKYDYAGTLEWRMFSATGSATRMQARLQFVWAVCKYVDPLLCNPLTTEGFLKALTKDLHLRRNTQVLRDYIVRSKARKEVFPVFASEVSKIQERENKKLLFEHAKKTANTTLPVAA